MFSFLARNRSSQFRQTLSPLADTLFVLVSLRILQSLVAVLARLVQLLQLDVDVPEVDQDECELVHFRQVLADAARLLEILQRLLRVTAVVTDRAHVVEKLHDVLMDLK